MADKTSRDAEKLQSDRQTVTDVAKDLGLNISTVRAWIHQDRIPARKDGRAWTIKRSDVQRFLNENPSFGHRHQSRETQSIEQQLRPDGQPRRPDSTLAGLDL
jgi:excisionase family DNA binding protein